MARDLSSIRHVVLDMDGTIYLGGTLFPETRPFLALLVKLGIGYTFVTNNNSRSRAEYVAHLQEMGIETRDENMFTSAHATIHYLQHELPNAHRLFVLGSTGLDDDLRLGGFEIENEHPQAVVVGYDVSLAFERLARCGYFIAQGLPYVATHPDRICPTDQPLLLPDCGAVCALLETTTGRRPDAIPGKPHPQMLHAILDRGGFAPHEVAMVGDRLYTDIRMARNANVCAVLTLTGEAKADEVAHILPENQPDVVVANLAELGRSLRDSQSPA